MDFKDNLYKLHMERIEAFKAQNSENEDFDVVFDFNGKKLYANKFTLCPVSTTFKSMLSDRWKKPGEPIEIKDYKFEDFKEFLTFIYSGDCELTDENVFAMVDMAEFYNIVVFKEICEEYLTKMKLDLVNVYPLIDLVYKYSLLKLKKYVHGFFGTNMRTISESNLFQNLEKAVLKDIVLSNQGLSRQEEMFEAVFKWAEIRVKENNTNQESITLNEAIKQEFSQFVPLFDFQKMSDVFFIKFVVKRASLFFSGDVLCEMFWSRCNKSVKIVDGNGKIMKGELRCDNMDQVVEDIQSKKDKCCVDYHGIYYYWDTQQPKPSTPSKLTKNDKIEWYLVYDSDGDLAVIKRNQLAIRDYLLAEMIAEDGFQFSTKCKVEISCFA
uniref:BTB domain-containing protein n=1 Tax=Panagrolaimus sp. ES5 TaxID=591445 RepID=A0AC34FKA3_9BILA